MVAMLTIAGVAPDLLALVRTQLSCTPGCRRSKSGPSVCTVRPVPPYPAIGAQKRRCLGMGKQKQNLSRVSSYTLSSSDTPGVAWGGTHGTASGSVDMCAA